MKRSASLLFVAIFFLLLALPAFGLLAAKSPQEGQSLEEWVEENVGFRDWLIWLHAKGSQALFGQSGNEQVLIGKDGWLFFDKTLRDYYRRELMTETQVAELVSALGALSASLEARGAAFTVLIAPNKNTIYPEWMPDYAPPGQEESNLGRVQEALEKSGVQVLDARRILRESKPLGRLYYQTDTHWNDLGALVVYRELIGRMAKPAREAYETYETLAWKEDQPFSGDLARLYLPKDPVTEKTVVAELSRSYRVKGKMRSLSDMTIQTESDRNNLRLWVARDSFGEALFPYLANNAGHLTFSRSFAIDLEAVSRQGVTQVVLEIAERNLPELLAQLEPQ